MEFYMQRIMVFAVMLMGILFAPFVAIQVVDGNFVPFFGFVGFVILILVFFGLKGEIWFLLPIATGLGWSLNFLPLGFNVTEISSLLVLAYMILVVFVMEKRKIQIGPLYIWVPLLLLAAIVSYHWFGTGSGFRLFGADTFGGRRHMAIVIGIFPYLVIMTCAGGRLEYLNKVPLVYMLATIVGSIPYLASTLFPSTAGIMGYFTGSANYDAARAEMAIGTINEAATRFGVLGTMGTAVQLWLLSHYRPETWWRPQRWWVLALSLLAFFMVVRSGYRNAVFTFGAVTIVALFLRSRWRALGILAIGSVVLLIMVVGHGQFFELPATIQRSLSFLPGEWSDEVVSSTEASDDFRTRMKSVYWREFGWESPLIGSGFAVDPRETLLAVETNQGGNDPDDVVRGFILRRDFHEGYLSLWNGTGAVGLILVVFLGFAFLSLIYRKRDELKEGLIQPIQIWVISLFVATYSGFFLVYGDMRLFYPALCLHLSFLLASLTKLETGQEGESSGAKDGKPGLPVQHGLSRGTF